MKLLKYLPHFILFLSTTSAFSQDDPSATAQTFPLSNLTIEPGLGLKPYPTSDLVVSNVAQWNIKKRFSVVSYSAYAYNSVFLRDFNYIKTDYNYSLTQKFGVATSVYGKSTSHTFSMMAGIKYDAIKETLDNPDFEKVSMSSSSVSPDFGLMYSLKTGKKKYFFSGRIYLPLYPYPLLTSDFNSFDGNLANISLELGVGLRIK